MTRYEQDKGRKNLPESGGGRFAGGSSRRTAIFRRSSPWERQSPDWLLRAAARRTVRLGAPCPRPGGATVMSSLVPMVPVGMHVAGVPPGPRVRDLPTAIPPVMPVNRHRRVRLGAPCPRPSGMIALPSAVALVRQATPYGEPMPWRHDGLAIGGICNPNVAQPPSAVRPQGLIVASHEELAPCPSFPWSPVGMRVAGVPAVLPSAVALVRQATRHCARSAGLIPFFCPPTPMSLGWYVPTRSTLLSGVMRSAMPRVQ